MSKPARTWSPQQKKIFAWFKKGSGHLVVRARAGTGKCLGINTPVLMHDGSTKQVQDIQIGDLLMGPDSKPRLVLNTTTGNGPLFQIKPIKGNPWVCNDAHVLTLVGTNHSKGLIKDIPLLQHLSESEAKHQKPDRNWKLLRAGIDFPKQDLPFDPYLIGLWIGNSNPDEAMITQHDPEIHAYCQSIAKVMNMRVKLRPDSDNNTTDILFTNSGRGRRGPRLKNTLRSFLRKVADHPEKKRIPSAYLVNDRPSRLSLLAGLLDSDGHYDKSGTYELTFKSQRLIQDTAYLARSLGFAAYYSEKRATIKKSGFVGYYWRLNISGNLDQIPCKVARKQAKPRRQVKDVLKTGFTATPLGTGKYFGFTLNDDGRFLLGDFTVTHNTTTILTAVEKYAPETRILLAAFNKTIATELQSRIKSPHVQAKTLHGLGFAYVRAMWGQVDVDTDGKRALDLAQQVCSPDDPSDAVRLVSVVHTKIRELQPHRSDVDNVLELMTDLDLMPDENLELDDGITPRWIAERVSKAVDLAKLRTRLIDFADMIFLPLVHNAVKPWYDLVVVDEAQDMSEPQLEMAIKACSTGGRIAVVGDDRQAIYGFRGADSGSIDRLKQTLKATELGLTVTYRCPKSVVAIAKEIVADFSAAPSAPDGIIANCSDSSLLSLAQPGDFILSRTNSPLVRVCLSLLRAGKRATIRGRDIGKGISSLVDRQRARDLTSLAKKLASWSERESKRAIASLTETAAENRIAYVQDIVGVVSALSEDVATVSELRSKLNTLFVQEPGNSIVCSTTHKAKGLEARNVYLLAGTFNGKRSGETEERNLLYVAITRSMHRLVWVSGFEK